MLPAMESERIRVCVHCISADLSKHDRVGLTVDRFSNLQHLLELAQRRVRGVQPDELVELYYADCKGRLELTDIAGEVLTVQDLTLVAAASDAWTGLGTNYAYTASLSMPAALCQNVQKDVKLEQTEDSNEFEVEEPDEFEQAQAEDANSAQSRSRSTDRSKKRKRAQSRSRSTDRSKKRKRAQSQSQSTDRSKKRKRANLSKEEKHKQRPVQKDKPVGCIRKVYARFGYQLDLIELHMRDKNVKKFTAADAHVGDTASASHKEYLAEDELLTSVTQVERGERLGASLTFETSKNRTLKFEGWMLTGRKWYLRTCTVDPELQICNLGFEGSKLVFVETLPANGKGHPVKRTVDEAGYAPPHSNRSSSDTRKDEVTVSQR